MMNYGEFQKLAASLVHDKKALGIIFQGRPQEQVEMRHIIKIVEKEWFEGIWADGKERTRFAPTDKAVERMRKRLALQRE